MGGIYLELLRRRTRRRRRKEGDRWSVDDWLFVSTLGKMSSTQQKRSLFFLFLFGNRVIFPKFHWKTALDIHMAISNLRQSSSSSLSQSSWFPFGMRTVLTRVCPSKSYRATPSYFVSVSDWNIIPLLFPPRRRRRNSFYPLTKNSWWWSNSFRGREMLLLLLL